MTHCGGGDTTLTDLPDVCHEAPATSGGCVALRRGRAGNYKKRRSSSTCVGGDCSTTPSSKSLSSSVDGEDQSSSADDRCGWGPVQPRCCQVFRSPKVVLVFLCCLATIQVANLLHLLVYFLAYIRRAAGNICRTGWLDG